MIGKILVFSPYYPPHVGGLESHSHEFNKNISKKGFEVIVLTPRLPCESKEREFFFNNRVEVFRFPAFEIIPNYPFPNIFKKSFWKIIREIDKKDVDIVISRTRFFLTSLMALIYSKLKHVKWIHIEHGSDYVKLSSKVRSFVACMVDQTMGRLIFMMCDAGVANSESTRLFCKKLYPWKKYEVIYRGVEKENIFKIKEDIKLKEKYTDKKIIVYLGRLIDGKGVQDLINVLVNIKRKNWVCLIVGDGPYRKNLEIMISEAFKNSIVFLGNLGHVKAISVVKIADIVVNPSYTEGLPTSVIEAALCKRAIIATDVGGTREIIENKVGGVLVQPKNVAQLKKAIVNLLEDNELRKIMSENAFDSVKQKFDWEYSIKKYINIFNKLCVE